MELIENMSYLFTRIKTQKQIDIEVARQTLGLLEGYSGITPQVQLIQINIFKITDLAIEYSEHKDGYSQWLSKADFDQLYIYYDIIGKNLITPYGQSDICSKPCKQY